MQFRPQAEEAEKYRAMGYDVLPVSAELFSDISTPIETLKALREYSSRTFLFESVEGGEHWARYSFLGFAPKMEIYVSDGRLTLSGEEEKVIDTRDPNEEIRKILHKYRSPKIDYLPAFTGGLVGYFAYEYYKYSEKVPMPAGEFGDCRLFLFDKVIAYDNIKHKIILIVNASLHGNVTENYEKAKKELLRLKEIILTGCKKRTEGAKTVKPFVMEFTEAEYEEKVKRAKVYTREGDIFQCVPSNMWTAEIEGDLLNTYRVLRTTNPSPYMIYMDMGKTEIAGASPETLVKLMGGKVSTFPIAGTRPRGKTAQEDRELEEGLLRDEKEIAEHNMLVDLGRNDLGKICKFGTLSVSDYKKIYRFSHVMHITSNVSGEICDGKDGLDALSATLPAGTLSGAPKKRAVEIIQELEGGMSRGVYGGAVGYLDFMGNCDFCIAIRTAMRSGKKVYVRAGGGIVEASVPRNEYMETCNKSAAVREAILRSGEVDY